MQKTLPIGYQLLLAFCFIAPCGLSAQEAQSSKGKSQDSQAETKQEGLKTPTAPMPVPKPKLTEDEKFTQCDADGNGKISKEEFKLYLDNVLPWFKQSDEAFLDLDEDKDSSVAREEFSKRVAVVKKIDKATKAKAAKTPTSPPETPKAVEFVDLYNQRFMATKPVLDDIISEELTAFNEKGEKVSFGDFRGKYTVINFGCMT
ncbi:MAG: hypothetical protein AB8B55_15340 [Mariniblastus sp.]